VKNDEVQKILTELDESNDGFFTRLLLIEGYINELEEKVEELEYILKGISK